MSDESANKRTHGRRHSRSPAEVSRLQRTRNAHQHGRRGALLPTPFPGFIYITEAADKGFLGILLQGRGSGPQGRVERTHWPPTSLSGLTVTRPHAIRKHNTPLADSGSQSVGLTHSPAPIGHSNARHRGAVFSPEDRAHSGPRTQTALSVALKFVQRDSGSISKPPSPKFLPSRWQPPPRAWACERRLCRWTRRGKGLRGARSVPCATTGRKAGAPQRGPITNPSSASPAAPARAPPPVPRPAAAGVRAPSRAPAAGGRAGPRGRDAAGARVQEAGGAGAPRPEPAPRGHLPRRCGDRSGSASATRPRATRCPACARAAAPRAGPAPGPPLPRPARPTPRAPRAHWEARPRPAPRAPAAPPGPPRGRPAPRGRPPGLCLTRRVGAGPGATRLGGRGPPLLVLPAPPPAPGRRETEGRADRPPGWAGRVRASPRRRCGSALGAGAAGLGPHGAGAEGGEWERPASAAGRRERAVSAPARSGRALGAARSRAALAVGGWGRGATLLRLEAIGLLARLGPGLPVSKRRPQRLFHCLRPSRDTCCPLTSRR